MLTPSPRLDMEDYIRGLESEVLATPSDPFGLGSSASSDKFAAFDAYVNKLVDDDTAEQNGDDLDDEVRTMQHEDWLVLSLLFSFFYCFCIFVFRDLY